MYKSAASRVQKKELDLSELELQEVVSHKIWVLRTESLSSKRFMCS